MNSGTSFAPTRPGGNASTLTVRCTPPTFTPIISPTCTVRAGFTRCPPMSTCPSRQALAARDRVLKRRTAQSHLSMRVSLFMPTRENTAVNKSKQIVVNLFVLLRLPLHAVQLQ